MPGTFGEMSITALHFYLSYMKFIILFIAGIYFVYYFLTDRLTSRLPPLPPGPKSLPLLGNAFDFPSVHEDLKYREWGNQYGHVTHVAALGKHIIALNSVKACNELLDQRSAIYSDRPSLPMIEEPGLMDAGWVFSAIRYSKRWKLHRRLFTQHLNQPNGNDALLLSDPKYLKKHMKYVSPNLLLGIAYGYTVQSGNDPLVELSAEVAANLTEGFQPNLKYLPPPLVKYVPIWFPGAGFKHFAQLKSVQKIAAGKTSTSLIQQALVEQTEGHDPNTEEDIKQVAATMYAAGADTTVAVLHALILQLVLNPAIQISAQKELGNILGSSESSEFRLPSWEDGPQTSYIEVLVKEIIRWNPAVETGGPHAVIQEDEYRGWRIPKGSIIFPNA
ncbi:hypothetical protein M422DRAFT_238606 [Sphaerobolus stellatus SS14]|nr:hypothetical protein M422DRAFT_238606 [Sphaerobolus stellatus SS14]